MMVDMLTPISGGMSREQFRMRMLKSMPESARERAKADWERWDALTEEQRLAEQEAKDKAERMKWLAATRKEWRDKCGLRGDQWLNTFANYHPDGNPEERQTQRLAWQAAKGFVEAWPDVTQGLMFWGEPGRGKDHLLHAIVNGILAKEGVWRMRYVYSGDLEAEFYAEWTQHNDEDTRLEERLIESALLLVGDLHRICRIPDSISVNARRIERAMGRVINHADATGLLRICSSTNYPLEDGKDGLDWETICEDPPLISRLSRIFEWIEVKGPDRRRQDEQRRYGVSLTKSVS